MKRVKLFLKKEHHLFVTHCHSRRAKHLAVGLILSLIGSFIALHPVHFMPEVVQDAFAYTLHGFGASPILRTVAEVIGWEV